LHVSGKPRLMGCETRSSQASAGEAGAWEGRPARGLADSRPRVQCGRLGRLWCRCGIVA
jgi:hypothetical protein